MESLILIPVALVVVFGLYHVWKGDNHKNNDTTQQKGSSMEWFNGKKTIIGSIMMTIAIFLTEVVIGIWAADWVWLPGVISTLNWVGMLLGGTGLIHKGIKAANTQ